MRLFYETYPATTISETTSRKSPRRPRSETPSRESEFGSLALRFRLSWSHYAMLVRARPEAARDFYEKEALRSGWTVRQLRRQIESQFYERTALSRNKATLMRKGENPKPGDQLTPDDEIRDPYVLEFLGLRDEYSEARLSRRWSSTSRAPCSSSVGTSRSWAVSGCSTRSTVGEGRRRERKRRRGGAMNVVEADSLLAASRALPTPRAAFYERCSA